MKKNNLLPIKWILGILIILIAVACWTTQQTQSRGQGISPTASNFFSQNNFFQFLANFFGTQGQNGSMLPTGGRQPGDMFKSEQQKNVSPGTLPSESASNVEAPQGTEPTAEQGNNAGGNPTGNSESNAGQGAGNINSEAGMGNNQENNAENNTGQETGNIPGTNAENNPGNNSEMNSGNNPGTNAENNPENNPGMNGDNNPETNAENNPNNNPENNPGNNPDNNPGNNPGSNLGNIPGSNLGNNPGSNPEYNPGNNSGTWATCVSGCYPGCNPGCDPQCTPPDCLLAGVNQSNLPTINPTPSDPVVSQNIANQNTQSAALAALLASREALVAPARQQAEASKYQTVDADNLPGVSTNQAPSDIAEKVKSNQVSLH